MSVFPTKILLATDGKTTDATRNTPAAHRGSSPPRSTRTESPLGHSKATG